MFGFFKKKAGPPENTIEVVAELLKPLGYELTEDGIGLVATEIASNYSAAEIVSHIILCTIALDAKEAHDDADLKKLMEIASSSISVSKAIKFFIENKWMHPSQYQNDVAALAGVSILGPEQKEWIEKILSDPMVSNKRLANRNSI